MEYLYEYALTHPDKCIILKETNFWQYLFNVFT